MTGSASRIWISLIVLIVWAAVTLFGAQFLAGGEEVSLNEIVTRGIGWQFVVAIAVLLIAIAVFKWKDIGFGAPHSVARVMWFPSLYLIGFAAAIVFFGFPPLFAMIMVFINTMMVGFSEEVMFRGVLFQASIKRMSVWPAIILNMVLFGGVHAFNGFITGDFSAAVLQSVAAGMSGLLFMAIVLRTGSLWPAIIYHGLWDCLVFLITVSLAGSEGAAADAEVPAMANYAPVLLNLPNFIFALILLRKIHKDPRFSNDAN